MKNKFGCICSRIVVKEMDDEENIYALSRNNLQLANKLYNKKRVLLNLDATK